MNRSIRRPGKGVSGTKAAERIGVRHAPRLEEMPPASNAANTDSAASTIYRRAVTAAAARRALTHAIVWAT